jgi:hypothetical protein
MLGPRCGGFFTHLRTRLALGRGDKGGEAFKDRRKVTLYPCHVVKHCPSLPRHADYVFSVHFSPLARMAAAQLPQAWTQPPFSRERAIVIAKVLVRLPKKDDSLADSVSQICAHASRSAAATSSAKYSTSPWIWIPFDSIRRINSGFILSPSLV